LIISNVQVNTLSIIAGILSSIRFCGFRRRKALADATTVYEGEKKGIKKAGTMITYVQLVDNSCHDVQDLRFACIRHVAVIVNQDSLKKGWHHACIDHFEIIRLLDIGINELQNLLFDGAKTANFGCLGSDLSCGNVSMPVVIERI
jgi:hypothetical protein